MPGFTTRWAYLSLEESERIRELCGQIQSQLPPAEFEKETSPHITIQSGLIVPDESVGVVEKCLQKYSLAGAEISVTGVDVWPADDPAVILLDVDLPLCHIQYDIQRLVRNVGGDVSRDSVPAHITLLTQKSAEQSAWRGGWNPYSIQEVLDSSEFDVPEMVTVSQVVVDQVGCELVCDS